MERHQTQQDNNDHLRPNDTEHVWNPLTPPLSNGNSQQQQLIHAHQTEDELADELFEKIQQLICDYMRQPHRDYLHCRVLRWSIQEDLSRLYSAVIVINPPAIRR
ncbi:unnamed protein product [Rotaria sp. Silwood2]|nr:unnamed protein product [Rotaria sp. Silwood2]CAF3069320.1 unnamed protein product [Rotaria sp. Silwood2]CAF3378517.1 unnamed protein product [Rotaria sp. Silwood2]CAF4310426.1 unnamed protein product [Rotaria sp. Silwood2]CAF4433588.1 unnamed protein product [Rotaria sp. Silwood2]